MADKYSSLTQERLQKLYTYDPDTGLLMSNRLKRPVGYNHDGYLSIELNKKHIKVHRVIWMIVHGKWPDPMIDHINGNRKDNRLCNLREVTAKQNLENNFGKGAVFKGVTPTKTGKRWKAQITNNSKTIYLGTFDFPEDAHKVYCQAAKVFHSHNPSAIDI